MRPPVFGYTNRNTTVGGFSKLPAEGFSLSFKIITRANIIGAVAAALVHPAPCVRTAAAVQLLEKKKQQKMKRNQGSEGNDPVL